MSQDNVQRPEEYCTKQVSHIWVWIPNSLEKEGFIWLMVLENSFHDWLGLRQNHHSRKVTKPSCLVQSDWEAKQRTCTEKQGIGTDIDPVVSPTWSFQTHSEISISCLCPHPYPKQKCLYLDKISSGWKIALLKWRSLLPFHYEYSKFSYSLWVLFPNVYH